MTDSDSRGLVERILRDDEIALGELIAAFAPRLLRFVTHALGGNRAEAEDVVQEVFIRLWRARHKLDPAASVKAYLFTIATRLAWNRTRGWRRAPEHVPLAEPGDGNEPAHAGPDPERLATAAQLRRRLLAEVSALAPNQRIAFLLRHEGGLAYQEIAAALDTSAAAVESLLARARARLRDRLREWMTEGNPDSRGIRE